MDSGGGEGIGGILRARERHVDDEGQIMCLCGQELLWCAAPLIMQGTTVLISSMRRSAAGSTRMA